MVSWLHAYGNLVGGSLFAARAAFLGWRFICVCAFGGFLLCFLIAYAYLTITSSCNALLLHS